MPGPRLVHVDDSLTAIKLFAAQVQATRPDLELCAFQSVSEACESLVVGGGLPWLLVTDINFPAKSGITLISWLRRHPQLHGMPVAVLSAAMEAEHHAFAASHGVIRWVAKPASAADVTELLLDRERMEGSVTLRETLEREFVVSGVQALEGVLGMLDRGGDTQALFHALHSFKGEAAALLFPELAKVAHAMETFVAGAREAGHRSLERVGGPLREGTLFLLEQLKRFGQRRGDLLLDEAPELLIYGLEALSRSLPAPDKQTAAPTKIPPPAPWDLPDIGIDIPSFERLQEKVRTVLKRSARLSERVREYTAQIKASDPTAAELAQLVKKLDNDCVEMASTLVTYFTVRGERIIAFLQTVVSEVSRFAGRRAALELDINPELEIDQAVYGSLKTIFVHLIRNALDHGIESAEERLKAAKPAAGMIRVSITPDRRFRYRVVFEDDGRGIDVDHLRREIASRGIQAPANNEKALELIFLDELTTKPGASTISGRGMGMGAIRRMIENRQGSIAVSSRPGQGTRFEITLTKVLKLQ